MTGIVPNPQTEPASLHASSPSPSDSVPSPQHADFTEIIPATQNFAPAAQAPPSHPMLARSKNHITKPKNFTDGIVRYPLPSALFADGVGVASLTEPTCYTSAMKDPHWRAAMNLEFDALLKNQTWVLVPPHLARNIVGCK